MDANVQQIRKKVRLFQFSDVGRYCKAIYEELRQVQRSYSIEAFSEVLGFGSNNTMAQVHSGHRKISEKAGERIVKILKLSRDEAEYFLCLVKVKHASRAEERDRLLALMLELSARHSESSNSAKGLEFFNSWLHSVVFEMLSMEMPQTLHEICNRMNQDVKEQAVEKSLDLLAGLGLVEIQRTDADPVAKYLRLQKDFSMGSTVPGLAIVRYHQEMLNLARESLIKCPPSERDVSSVTISVDPEQVERIKKDIELFRKYLLFLSTQARSGTKVMQVNVQLFPLSK